MASERGRVWLCGWLLAMALPAVADVITIRADEWLPYNGGSKMKPPGYMIEMADAIAKKNGHTLDYRNMPWENAVVAVREGLTDCAVGAYKADAPDLMFPSKGWGKSANAFYGYKDSAWRFDGMESLAKVRVGIAEGYSYGDDLDAYFEANKADPTKVIVVPVIGRAIVRLIARVVSRKVDVFLEDTNVATYGLKSAGIDDRIVSLGLAGQLDDVFIACTPKTPRGRELADMFDKGAEEMRKSGELAKILANYSLPDWDQAAP